MRSTQSDVSGGIRDEQIVAGHGAGGRKMHRLIGEVFLRQFGSAELRRLEDAAVLAGPGCRLALSTDSYVVRPLFFPGGDIGKLAVCGTVNDLAMVGAVPDCLSVAMVIREGTAVEVVGRVARSIGRTCRSAGVRVVTGDTKVIERGEDEGLYVNTTGVGRVAPGVRLGAERIRRGDAVVLSGGIGEHEAAIAVARGLYGFRSRVKSDCACLHRLVATMLRAGEIRMMRDPTRGGLATTLNEMADASGFGITVFEDRLPVRREVRGVASLLGLDPLYMANEGKVVAVCSRTSAARMVRAMRRRADGRHSAVIGTVSGRPAGVWIRTAAGGLRRLMMHEGAQLPRIC